MQLINTTAQNNVRSGVCSGDYSSLLSRGGNFGCGASARNDFIGSDFFCQDNYNQGITLASAPSSNKMIVCIRLPPTIPN